MFQPFGGQSHQLRMNGQIPVGIGDMRMAKKRRQHRQAPFDIFMGAIPLNQRVDGKSMAEIVNPRTGAGSWSPQANPTRQVVERPVHRGDFQTTSMIVEEKRR